MSSFQTSLPRSLLVVGSGGREHALVRALVASPDAPRVICAPGNAGIAEEVPCFPIAADDVTGLVALVQREQIAFVVVGPEVPLSSGSPTVCANWTSPSTAPAPTARG